MNSMTTQPPYQTVPFHNKSFLQKLFKQHPDENAIIAVNNLLATTPMDQINRAMILKIGVEYGVDVNKLFPLNMQEFYAVYLNFILRKHQLGYEDDNSLHHLQSILGLSNEKVQELHERVGKIWYEKALKKCVRNGVFSHGEEKAMATYARHLRLPERITNGINKDMVQTFIDN